MKKRMLTGLLAGGLLAALLPGAVVAQEETEDVSLLFVVSAPSGSVAGDTLTLEAVPSVVWFTDRPARDTGHVEPAALAAAWDAGADSFADDPPNAVLSLLDEDTVADVVLELTGIASDGDGVGVPDDMSFTFEVLDGELPAGAFGTASLFIDGMGAAQMDGMGMVMPGCLPECFETSDGGCECVT